jgi:hypothetical protein
MAYKIFVLKRAREHLWEGMDWYNEQSSGLGNKLMNEFFDNLKKLQENPHRFKYVFKPFRRSLLKNFHIK